MTIVPDDKNWTWVLERRCPDCGFDAGSFVAAGAGDEVLANARRWLQLLQHPLATRRPSATQWSALEYACHVRDVFKLYEYRLGLMLDHDNPTFANWDQDETAITDRYADQDPGTVARELSEAAESFASAISQVTGDDWARTGQRSDGASFTIDSFTRYLMHDPVHHVWDVEQGNTAL